ncbi:MAG: peptidoglycan DD-metalloendopeptidase family protein [Acidobacteria bacterium]|nr:peptidoglycan DD-metalloendopeptidase family protein [Acidobacteriota bacterium]
MARFPLSVVPAQNYHYGGIKFGAERKKKDGSLRTHAACDLVAAPGTPVVAVEWGIVLDVPKTPFIEGTKLYSVIIEHSFFIGRYTEINRDDIGSEIYPGATVQEGQYISTLQRNGKGGAMLHFEMYDKSSAGYLSQPSNTKYKNVPAGSYGRRSDLMNPTPYLDQWLLWTVWL